MIININNILNINAVTYFNLGNIKRDFLFVLWKNSFNNGLRPLCFQDITVSHINKKHLLKLYWIKLALKVNLT